MLKFIVIGLLIGMSCVQAENVQSIEKLETEKKALQLKLEAYALKKKIIELENFIENDKIKKEKKVEREKALIRLKNDLRSKRNYRMPLQNQNYKG